MAEIRIRCPKCEWEPNSQSLWKCSDCGCTWNTFATRGQCPDCSKRYKETACTKCGKMSSHADWYEGIQEPSKSFFSIFKSFKKEEGLPVTEADKNWVEQSMIDLIQMFSPDYFKQLTTITPDKKHFDYPFRGDEGDAHYVLERLVEIMHIDPWEIELVFYSNGPVQLSGGITTTPQQKLKGGWKDSAGQYVDNGFGHKQIRIEVSQLKDTTALTATMAHELAHYKLLGESRIDENDENLTDLTAIAFGFGIFMGNSRFKISKWQNYQRQGWEMSKSGYLPEPVIAYAMAWLAFYREEEGGWETHLNPTMKTYFDRCCNYINQNGDKVRWE